MIDVTRIGGLDFGDKTIGVALSDELGWTAQGLEVIRRRNSLKQDLARLGEIAAQYGVERWVVGMPRNMNGTYGPRSELTRAFVAELEKLGLPVETYDERMTTMQAERVLLEADVSRAKRKKVIDKMAAAVILQSYLDARAIRKAREEATQCE